MKRDWLWLFFILYTACLFLAVPFLVLLAIWAPEWPYHARAWETWLLGAVCWFVSMLATAP